MHQVRHRLRAIEALHGTGQGGEPGEVAGEIAAFAGAVVVVRGPVEKILDFLVPPAAGSDGGGTGSARLTIAQAPKADLGGDLQEHHHVE